MLYPSLHKLAPKPDEYFCVSKAHAYQVCFQSPEQNRRFVVCDILIGLSDQRNAQMVADALNTFFGLSEPKIQL